ncbi:co-chaperone YbbN [uncultured Bacteroides sp.]|uniref:thioredoxin family protein n=1 Tax=uncultured Bacteroides sp. TaxID=162156 RepID=UPI0025EFFFC0|nr:thioredoxin family protein [uncultured Bacteroides sp.]
MDIVKQLEAAERTGHLVLIVFYADWSPHYEWMGPVLHTYERRIIELIRINAEENKNIADSFNIENVPAFLLLYKGHELWRQMGELTVEELKDVLDDFPE